MSNYVVATITTELKPESKKWTNFSYGFTYKTTKQNSETPVFYIFAPYILITFMFLLVICIEILQYNMI